MRRRVLFCLCCVFGLLSCTKEVEYYPVSDETQGKQIISGMVNAENALQKPYVVLVSLDGFRNDYAERFEARNLLSFSVKAEGLMPGFPTKTFPNHYSIVTGLYPGENGLLSNSFYDKSLGRAYSVMNRQEVEDTVWYKGKPLWVLAQEQGMVSASMMWVGSEAPIKGHFPAYYFIYDRGISNEDRVNTVVNWLQLPADKRPHFITLYFSDTDDAGHRYGPDAPETSQSVRYMDAVIGDLKNKLDRTGLPINLIVVSDHGMKSIDTNDLIRLSKLMPAHNGEAIISYNVPLMIYSEDSVYLRACYDSIASDERLEIYWGNALPDQFHYKMKDRIGDLVIMPKPGYVISEADSIAPGSSTHGYDPADCPEMMGAFYATGPNFKSDQSLPVFENIHIYPLVADILRLSYDTAAINGRPEVLAPILK